MEVAGQKNEDVASYRPPDWAYVIKRAAALRKRGSVPNGPLNPVDDLADSRAELEKRAIAGLIGRGLAAIAPRLGLRFGARMAGLGARVGGRAPGIAAYFGGRGLGTMARAIPRMSDVALSRAAPMLARGPEWAGAATLRGLMPSGEAAALRAMAADVPAFGMRAVSRDLLPGMKALQTARRIPAGTQMKLPGVPAAPSPVPRPPAGAPVPETGGQLVLPGMGAPATAGTGAAATGKVPFLQAYAEAFQPGGMKALWADKWIKYPTIIGGALEAPKVLSGEHSPLEGAFNVLAPIPAFRAGIGPGLVAGLAAPMVGSRIFGQGQPQSQVPMPMPMGPPINVNVESSPVPMPPFPQMMQAPSMIPGVRL